MSLFAGASSLSLSLLSPCLRTIFSYKVEKGGDFLAKITHWFLTGGKFSALIKLQIALVGAFLTTGIFRYLHEYTGALLEEKIMKEIRDKTYSHLHTLSLTYFHQTDSGEIISRLTNDISLIKNSIKLGVLIFWQHLLLIFGYFCFAFYISWRLLVFVIIIFPLLGYLISRLSKRLRQRSNEVQQNMSKITTHLKETITGIKVVQAFYSHNKEIKKFLSLTSSYFKSAMRFERISLLNIPVSEFIASIGACVILSYGGYLILKTHSLLPERFFIFLGCAILMMQSLRYVAKANSEIQRGVQALCRVNKIFAQKTNVKETPSSTPFCFEKEIYFKDVCFEYKEGKVILSGVNLRIKKGEHIAIVGRSGVGKSTLVELLLRFYEPKRGKIEIDGIDLQQFSIPELRKKIAMVPQRLILFNDTVINNICYGEEEIDLNLVRHAAKLAHIDEVIQKLPKGYETVIGEDGIFFSRGECQRIAIARAFYRDPEILILDEATAHLDLEVESKIQDAIRELLKGRTALVIAHRIETVRRCDRIVVLEEGKIEKEGTHKELMESSEVYRSLVRTGFDE